MEELREKFDWVICDSPAGIERGATLAMRHADVAVVVTNPEVSSVRDSDRIIGLLDSKTIKAEKGETLDKHLILTRYDAARAARGDMLKVEDVLEILSLPLLAIIPDSQEVLRASNVGCPVTLNNPLSAPARAYADAVRRLLGETVPMSVPSDRKSFLEQVLHPEGRMNLPEPPQPTRHCAGGARAPSVDPCPRAGGERPLPPGGHAPRGDPRRDCQAPGDRWRQGLDQG